jgi:hypothetical protein
MTKIKSAFRIFESPRYSGPYCMSTFKVFIPGFYYSGNRGCAVSRSMCRLRVTAAAPLLY